MKKMILFLVLIAIPLVILARPERMEGSMRARQMMSLNNRAYRLTALTSYYYYDDTWNMSGAGNIYHLYANKDYTKCSGLLSRHPGSAWLWILGFVFIVGLPPSPLFFSEFFIAIGLLGSGQYLLLGIWVLLLAVITYGLGKAVLSISMGKGQERAKLPFLSYLPGYILLILAICSPLLAIWTTKS